MPQQSGHICVSHASCRYYGLCVGRFKCHSRISVIHQYEHRAVFSLVPPPPPLPCPLNRKWQPDNTLQVSKVNAPEHCLCCASLRVKVSPHRCGDFQRGLNLIKPVLGRLPFVSCRGFHYHRRVYLPSASLICTLTKPACRHVITGTDRNIQSSAAMYWHLQSILGTSVALTWSFAMFFCTSNFGDKFN